MNRIHGRTARAHCAAYVAMISILSHASFGVEARCVEHHFFMVRNETLHLDSFTCRATVTYPGRDAATHLQW
jgi:hypothetical protein